MGSQGRGIGWLTGLAVLAVAAAVLGVGFVAVRRVLTGSDTPAEGGRATPTGQVRTGETAPPVQPQMDAPSIAPKTSTSETITPQTMVAVDPRLKQAPTKVKHRRRAALTLRKEPLIERSWDKRTGELIVGRRRLLGKAKRVRGLKLTEAQNKALKKFEEEFRRSVEVKLEQIEENLQSAREAYHNAAKNEDTGGQDHYLDEHGRLSEEQERILEHLDQQYEDGLKEILSEEQLDELSR